MLSVHIDTTCFFFFFFFFFFFLDSWKDIFSGLCTYTYQAKYKALVGDIHSAGERQLLDVNQRVSTSSSSSSSSSQKVLRQR